MMIAIGANERKIARHRQEIEEVRAAERERCAGVALSAIAHPPEMYPRLISTEILALPPGDGAVEDVRREAVKPYADLLRKLSHFPVADEEFEMAARKARALLKEGE